MIFFRNLPITFNINTSRNCLFGYALLFRYILHMRQNTGRAVIPFTLLVFLIEIQNLVKLEMVNEIAFFQQPNSLFS